MKTLHFFLNYSGSAVQTGRGKVSVLRLWLVGLAGTTGPFVLAHQSAFAADTALPEMAVRASAEKPQSAVTLQNSGLPSRVTVIDREEIERTNVGRDYTDLLRRVPGINAYSFGQGDIGSPIKMRGFVGTGSHGGDVAIYVDGVPQNFPSAAQGGPGMSDLAWLTADMIERIEVIRGPFSALYGDQNRAGAVNIVTRNSALSNIGIAAGSFSTLRGNAVYSGEHGPIRSLGVAELYNTDGYRDNSDITRGNLLAKGSLVSDGAIWALRGNYYRADFNSPGYLAVNDLDSGRVNTRSRNPDAPPLFGDAERFGLVLTRTPLGSESGLFATAYVEHYTKERALPVTGLRTALNVQNDRRWIAGARGVYNLALNDKAAIAFGGEFRSDQGDGVNQRWLNGNPTDNYTFNYDLKLLTYAAFVQGQYKVLKSLKLVGGVRHDQFDYSIGNRKFPASSVSDYNKGVTTPRAGLVWTPLPNLDLFANYGEGFRSPAERELSPGRALGPLNQIAAVLNNPDLAPPKVKARDLGFNARLGSSWQLAAAKYWTKNQQEIREQPAGSGNFISVGDTRRDGWEVEGRFFATPDLDFYASFGRVKARVLNPLVPGQDLIPGLPEDIAKFGFAYSTSAGGGRLFVNGDAAYISGQPFYVGSSPEPGFTRIYTRYDLRLGYDIGKMRYLAYATFQPIKYGSEQAGAPASAALDTRPYADLGVGVRYFF